MLRHCKSIVLLRARPCETGRELEAELGQGTGASKGLETCDRKLKKGTGGRELELGAGNWGHNASPVHLAVMCDEFSFCGRGSSNEASSCLARFAELLVSCELVCFVCDLPP